MWNEEELQQLKTWISEKMADSTENLGNRPLQDSSEIPQFLTLKWWNFLQTTESQLERVEKLTLLCGALGLPCPSERTVAFLRGAERSLSFGGCMLPTDTVGLTHSRLLRGAASLVSLGGHARAVRRVIFSEPVLRTILRGGVTGLPSCRQS